MIRPHQRWSCRYCWERHGKQAAPRLFGWNERCEFARFLNYRMQQFNAALIGIESIRQGPCAPVKRREVIEVLPNGNAAWQALSDERRSR